MAADVECSHVVLDFLKRHNYVNSMDSFLLECPHVDINDEPQVDETLEVIMEHHKSSKKFKREWEEFGEGQLLNQLCTKLQENIEEIKDFMVGAHKMNEGSTRIKNRSRSMRRSQKVNLMHPLTVSSVRMTKTSAANTVSVLTDAAAISPVSRSPFKRKPISPQKRLPQLLSPLPPSSSPPPAPLAPLAPGPSGMPSRSGPTTSLSSVHSGPPQTPQSEIEQIIERMLNDQGLPQKLADSINNCAVTQPDDSDNFIQTVLHQMTQSDPSFGQLLEPAITGGSPPTPQAAPTPANEPEVRTVSSPVNLLVRGSQSSTSQVTPTLKNGFNSELSIDSFLDQLHNSST